MNRGINPAARGLYVGSCQHAQRRRPLPETPCPRLNRPQRIGSAFLFASAACTTLAYVVIAPDLWPNVNIRLGAHLLAISLAATSVGSGIVGLATGTRDGRKAAWWALAIVCLYAAGMTFLMPLIRFFYRLSHAR